MNCDLISHEGDAKSSKLPWKVSGTKEHQQVTRKEKNNDTDCDYDESSKTAQANSPSYQLFMALLTMIAQVSLLSPT
jgi:hypothetical protein